MPKTKIVEQLKIKSKKKPKTLLKWNFPTNAETEYRRELYSLTFLLRELINELLIPALPSLVEEANFTAPEQPRNDAFLDSLFRIMDTIRNFMRPKEVETARDAIRIGETINEYNERQFEKVTKSAFGIDIFVEEPWLEDQLELFATQNAQLITSLTEDEIERVSGTVQRAFQQGLPLNTLTDQIQSTFGIARRHAKLIARDQTTKLNASLTKLRQESIGVTAYTWQTSADERVRASHRLMDTLECKWDDPSVYRNAGETRWRKRTSKMPINHVGGDVNCRCVARAIVEGY